MKRLNTTDQVDALLISASDKLNNARSIIRDYRTHGPSLWKRFNPDADQKWYYGEVARVVTQRLSNPIVDDLNESVTTLRALWDSDPHPQKD